jgi:16S rRNA processing protein RimM
METGSEALVPVGRIVGAHGLAGEVVFRPYNPDSDQPRPRSKVYLVDPSGTPSPVRVRSVRPGPKGVLVRFDGVLDRTAAEALRGREVAVPRSSLPPPGEGEFYWVDVIGAPVRVRDKDEIGRVAEVFRGATDVIVVRGEGGERMVPVVEGFVIEIGPAGVLLDPAALEEPE